MHALIRDDVVVGGIHLGQVLNLDHDAFHDPVVDSLISCMVHGLHELAPGLEDRCHNFVVVGKERFGWSHSWGIWVDCQVAPFVALLPLALMSSIHYLNN